MADTQRNALLWTAIGSGLAFCGLAADVTWVTFGGIVCTTVPAIRSLHLRGKHPASPPWPTHIEGLNIDSLYIANLRRRLNQTLTLRRAFQVAIVNGADLNIAWQYDGVCRSEPETSIEFSIDSESSATFEQLDCVVFDLRNDPQRQHPIQPSLLGGDGLSKKIQARFLQPLSAEEPFNMLLQCRLPNCISTGVQYYTSSLSFDQRSIDSSSVHLIFVGARPEWVRVYQCRSRKEPKFLGDLRAFRDDGVTCEYFDIARDVPGQSVLVYLYNLPPSAA